MTKKYQNKEYFPYNRINFPYNKFFFVIAKIILTIPKLFLHSNKKIEITKQKINKTKVYIFNPRIKTQKIMLYIHGGGFTFYANPKTYKLCKKYALLGKCKVIYIDYKLAPKYKYPYQLNECINIYKWIINNNKNKEIIIGGDSAGGCLSVELTNKILEEKIKIPNKLLLIYPVLDHKMTTQSMKVYNDKPLWNSKLNKKMWKYYTNDKNYKSPYYIKDLKKFPVTYIETTEYDCLHDEGIEFYKKLKKEKVQVELNETENTIHGYDIKNTKTTKRSIKQRINFIKK